MASFWRDHDRHRNTSASQVLAQARSNDAALSQLPQGSHQTPADIGRSKNSKCRRRIPISQQPDPQSPAFRKPGP
jgi:hypothetical protein